MGKGKSGGEFEVNEYLMSMHVGVCVSADELKAIYIGEKTAWEGTVSSEQDINVSAPSLFGGPKKEGGVQGTVRFLPGSPNQVLPDFLAQKMGRESGADCPGFRGLTTLFFTGSGSTGVVSGGGFAGGIVAGIINSVPARLGFHWVTNNPYLKDLWIKVRRVPKGLNPALATVPRNNGSGLTQFGSGAAVVLKWWQRSYPQAGGANDRARMGVRYYGRDGEPLGDINWAPLIATPTDVWTERTLNSAIPANCFGVRVYMEMERVSGSYNDGYIDDISLSIGGSNVPVTNAGGEISGNLGWINEVGDVGQRFSNPTPRTGTAYFTGGSHALSRAYQSFTGVATGDDANPAHMIYECLTNTDWGMGGAAASIDRTSFENAASTLVFEGLGLSMLWTRQATIESFISEILDHIVATLFVNPRNGLLTLKLIRGDYNLADLRSFTPDNALMSNFQRKSWGEIINEIVVTWTNPENEQDETVTLQDNAAIAAQGGIVSDSRNYYGVRSAELAMRLAARDLRTASTPLASCDMEVSREAWDVLPGEVVKLTWPEKGLNAVPMRVGTVDYGRPGDPSINVSLLEDIFSYATTDYTTPPSTGWEDDNVVPDPMQHAKVITVPSFFAANYLPQATTGLADIEYPEVVAGVLATSPNAISYDLYGDRVQVDGAIIQESLTTNTCLGRATLTTPLAEDYTSQFVGFSNFAGRVFPGVNVFAFIGGVSEDDTETEIALISDVEGSGFTLRRGILDTIPRAWDAGTPVYFVQLNSGLTENIIRSDGETVTYKLLSRTVGGILDVDAAGTVTGTLSGRPHYPLRPANVKVNDQAFGTVDVSADTTITVTWSNRNRTLENSQVVYWDDATVPPEAGQTTTVSLLTETGVVITEWTNLSGTSHTFPKTDLGSNTRAVVRVKAVRDGFDSLQAHRITIDTTAGSGSGGEVGGGGGTGGMPSSVSWSSFDLITGTSYQPLTSVQSISTLSGSTVTAEASLSYTAIPTALRFMNAKFQYRITGTTDWQDMGTPERGSSTTIDAETSEPISGEVSFTRTLTGIPANDYDVRLVGNVSAGGVSLFSVGTASVTVTGGTPPPGSGGGSGGGGSSTAATAFMSAENLGEQTTTGTTLSNLLSTTVIAANQTPNAKYVGFFGAEFNNATNGVETKVQLTKNGVAVFPSDMLLRTNYNTEYPAIGGMFLHDAGATPADVTYALQYAPVSASTLKGRNARLSWLKLGANDASMTSYEAQTTTSTTQVDAGVLTFSPPSAGDYMVLCSFTLSNSASTATAFVQLTDGTTSGPEIALYGANSSKFTALLPLSLVGVSGAKNVSLKVRSSSGTNTITIMGITMVALRLSRFANVYSNLLSGANTGTDTTYTATATQTFTPAAAKHFSIATWNVYGGAASSTSRTQVKFTDAGTDVGVSDMALVSSTASRAIVGAAHRVADYTATSHTQTLFRAANAGASVSIGQGSGIITLSLAGLS